MAIFVAVFSKKNMKYILILLSLGTLFLTSCIKDEPLYREADIVSFTIKSDDYISSSMTEDRVQLVLSAADKTNLIPEIEVSPGATISPASGVAQDFTNDVVYTVVSEDGNYSKRYTVSVTSRMGFKYDFENWTEEGAYWKYPAMSDPAWKSANQGVMTAKAGNVTEYPTRSTIDAYRGKYAALLETQVGGNFFVVGYVPVFSGSLFRGDFKLQMSNPAKSPLFGQIHPKEDGKPLKMTGYYKYTPGEKLINKQGEVAGQMDECSIYAVLYKVTKGAEGQKEYLDGTNILTSDKVVATAILEDRTAKKEYTKFELPFIYKGDIDYSQNDYKLAIVFASSKNGDFYEGAVGSTLIVDEVEVECESFDEN